ncbi:thiosulfate oxidation carrier protein SoxY [Sedimenticola thiotaurini]|uniref:Sulfur oxidation protein SoxY n=1 Tax=Sedimenticola thiotaurini TaxID=1543721 RepID=A0A0F7JRV2_9GAMM|nr:thiosulfate oxidation carrier protein SoxY [Sedimenticola thiotaurini]AKH19196.1 sulfur oxidation protein SoxY [Sedimenticola thiotaurini]
MKRRLVMKRIAMIGSAMFVAGTGTLTSRSVLAARPQDAFEAQALKDALTRLYGEVDAEPSDRISLKLPDIAENGAVVPVTVSSDLTGIESIAILAENNVNPLVATFKLGPKSMGYVGTRIKMAKTANVVAIVKADGKLYSTQKEVKVTIGGCGG